MSALRAHVSRCPLSTATATRTSTRTWTGRRGCSNDVRAREWEGACGRARVSSARANFQPLNSANSLALASFSKSSPPSTMTTGNTPSLPNKTRSFHVSLPTWTSLLRKRGSDHQTQTGAIQKKPLDSESQQRSITTMAAPTSASTAAAPKDPATHSNYDEISTTHVRLSSFAIGVV